MTRLFVVLSLVCIDPDLDLDKFRLVAAPKCQTCGGEGVRYFEPVVGDRHYEETVTCPDCRGTGHAAPKCETCGGSGDTRLVNGSEWRDCPACRGTGGAGVPVILPAEIAEHLPALLMHAAWSLSDDYQTPETFPGNLMRPTVDALLAWLEAQP